MTTQSTVPGPTADPLAAFRRFPTGITVFLGLFVVGGLFLAYRHLGADAVAMCGDDPMAPGDECQMTSRRRRRISSSTSIQSYEERLTASARAHESWVWVGVAVAVIAAILIALVVIRWRRDTALARTLDGGQEPLATYSATTGTGVGLGFLGAAAVAGIALAMGVRMGGVSGESWIGLAIVGVGVVVALLIVWAARPKGSTLVRAYDSGVRVVTQSRAQEVPWADLQYFVDLESTTFMQLGWVGFKRQLMIDDKEFFATMRARINSAARARVQESAGTAAPVDFGKVTLAGRTVVVGKKELDAGSLAAITPVKGKDGLELHVRDRSGGTPATVRPVEIANSDVLFGVLSEHFGVVVPGR
ncbi:hypothetical protein [Georgenia sp. Z1491]|uniref:hypothetical protein n=1 Tax=Georgenia sp. Z1491 TaxID=3416707 RepID=UPI003CFB3C13